MKITKLLPLLLLCFAINCKAAQLHETTPFSLFVSTTNETQKAGEPIHLIVTLKNVSAQKLLLFRKVSLMSTDAYIMLDVKDDRGNPVALNDYNIEGLPIETDANRGLIKVLKSRGSFRPFSLNSGEKWQEDFIISKLYALRKPGVYKVTVSREIPEQYGSGIVKSNTVKITVTK